MKEIILKQYKEHTALSESNYAYTIEGDDETLKEIAKEIEKALLKFGGIE